MKQLDLFGNKKKVEKYVHFCYLPNRWNEELQCPRNKEYAEPECKGCRYYKVVVYDKTVGDREFRFNRWCKYEEQRLEFDRLLFFVAFMLKFLRS